MSEPVPSLDELFGLSVPEVASEVPQFRSRRELRAAERGTIEGPLTAAALQPAPSVPAALPSRRELRARAEQVPAPTSSRRTARTEQPHSRPAHRRRSHSPLRAGVTVLAVAGMFGVMGLPAYASMSVPAGPDAVLAAGEDLQPEPAVQTRIEGQTLTVGDAAASVSAVRDGFGATSSEDLAMRVRDELRAANNSAYLRSGARELGDDYPWFYELSSDQGGGLSPLNYYYRECVDFVAWRLNRDAGYTQAPFKWVWSNLTPGGGDGSQWRWAWESKGWPVSDVPIAGAVAVIGYNHVAYVKQVNDDGTVLLEEYNFNYSHQYGQRTVRASQASAYLYPPS